MKSRVLFILVSLAIIIVGAGFTFKTNPEKKPWPVPENYKKMKNPVKSDAESLATGKTLWAKHCQSCHGKSGQGDGPKAAQLKTEAGNFSKEDTQEQPDGSMFYKSSEGRGDMPSFKKKIPDQEELWSIVNYIRTFKK
jgi:mono/diheme cytochrome c family protein